MLYDMFLQISAFCEVFSHALYMLFRLDLLSTLLYCHGKFVATTLLSPPEDEIVRLCIYGEGDHGASYVVKVVKVVLLLLLILEQFYAPSIMFAHWYSTLEAMENIHKAP